ncbi:MAG: tetratricopeptide repeat protein [Saprospiraceae bacterium]|nr:tetratricopeptide repeat protein [Saprospiraceae bacterium]
MENSISELLRKAWVKRREEKYREARQLVVKAQGLCEDTDFDSLGRIFHIYMQFESDHNNHVKALELCEQSLTFYRKGKRPGRIAHSIRHVADLQRHLGKEVDAEYNYREAINIYRDQSDTSKGDLANALRGFGYLLEKIGKVREASAVWKEVKELYQACHLQDGVVEANRRLNSLQF